MQCIARDGREGLSELAPYDRIITWTTPAKFPVEWKKQLSEYGVLVAPFPVLDVIAGSIVTVRFTKREGALCGDQVRPEGYITMTSGPQPAGGFGYEVHADLTSSSDNACWATSKWMKSDKGIHFAFHPDYGYFVGYSSIGGFALLIVHRKGQWVISSREHANILLDWIVVLILLFI